VVKIVTRSRRGEERRGKERGSIKREEKRPGEKPDLFSTQTNKMWPI
tara:strand:+ start:73 stop:213 length:141 start_codon:yes stop_codon:yes gene_type:complete